MTSHYFCLIIFLNKWVTKVAQTEGERGDYTSVIARR